MFAKQPSPPNGPSLDPSAMHARGVFVPVVPVFVEAAGAGAGDLVLSIDDVNACLGQEQRSLEDRLRQV